MKNLRDLRILRDFDSIHLIDDQHQSEFVYSGNMSELHRTMKLLKWIGIRVDTDEVEDYVNERRERQMKAKT